MSKQTTKKKIVKRSYDVKEFFERITLLQSTLKTLDEFIEERHSLTDYYLEDCLGSLTKKDKKDAQLILHNCQEYLNDWTKYFGSDDVSVDDPIYSCKMHLLNTSIGRCSESSSGRICEVDYDDPSEGYFIPDDED